MKDLLIQQGLNWFDHEEPWVLLYFSASWCAPCKTMLPLIAEATTLHSHQLKTVKVDVDDHMELVRKFDIRGVPTLILLNESAPKGRLVGGASIEQIERWLILQFDKSIDERY